MIFFKTKYDNACHIKEKVHTFKYFHLKCTEKLQKRNCIDLKYSETKSTP